MKIKKMKIYCKIDAKKPSLKFILFFVFLSILFGCSLVDKAKYGKVYIWNSLKFFEFDNKWKIKEINKKTLLFENKKSIKSEKCYLFFEYFQKQDDNKMILKEKYEEMIGIGGKHSEIIFFGEKIIDDMHVYQLEHRSNKGRIKTLLVGKGKGNLAISFVSPESGYREFNDDFWLLLKNTRWKNIMLFDIQLDIKEADVH